MEVEVHRDFIDASSTVRSRAKRSVTVWNGNRKKREAFPSTLWKSKQRLLFTPKAPFSSLMIGWEQKYWPNSVRIQKLIFNFCRCYSEWRMWWCYEGLSVLKLHKAVLTLMTTTLKDIALLWKEIAPWFEVSEHKNSRTSAIKLENIFESSRNSVNLFALNQSRGPKMVLWG